MNCIFLVCLNQHFCGKEIFQQKMTDNFFFSTEMAIFTIRNVVFPIFLEDLFFYPFITHISCDSKSSKGYVKRFPLRIYHFKTLVSLTRHVHWDISFSHRTTESAKYCRNKKGVKSNCWRKVKVREKVKGVYPVN